MLDDAPQRVEKLRNRLGSRGLIHWAATASEAIAALASSVCFDLIMLDHDLEDQHYIAHATGSEPIGATGMAVVEWLVRNQHGSFRSTPIIVHSLNEPAGQRMVDRLRDAGLDARYVPWAWESI